MADLWTLQLYIANRQERVSLVFHSEAGARAALARVQDSPVQAEFPWFIVEDNYGTTATVFGGGPLEAVVLQDCGRASEGGIELGLQNARNQARAQELAARDETLKKAAQRQTLVQAQPFPVMPPGKM